MESTISRYLAHLYEQYLPLRDGAVADYIPQLKQVPEDGFGIALATVSGNAYEIGDLATRFTIQSISKPFTYGLALMDHGIADMARFIDVEPSGDPFNEIRVDSKSLHPSNAMINAGAITATSRVKGDSPAERFDRIQQFSSRMANRHLDVDMDVFDSEIATADRNRAIGYLLREFGVLTEAPEAVLDSYTRQCSMLVTCQDLAWMAATLANDGCQPLTGERLLPTEINRHVLSVMATCGMYNGSGEWLTTVGLPAKSGVGGGIIAVLPGQCGIAIYSPRLDQHGNSLRGVAAFKQLSDDLGFHFLNVSQVMRPVVKSVHDLDVGDSSAAMSVRIIELQGGIQFSGAEEVERLLLSDEYPATSTLIFDLSLVDAIDEVARRMFLGLKHQLEERNIQVAIVDPEHGIRHQSGELETPVFDTRDAALVWANALGRGEQSGRTA